jgi:electron transport complex protein RnfB
MSDEIYQQLAKVLDTLPNGFPASGSGIETKLLKKIFKPDDVELFCDLKLSFETAEQIAQRTGRPLEGLEDRLTSMWRRGQIFGVDLGSAKIFKMVPWAFGIYEFQLPHMDRELAEMCEEYMPVYGRQFFKDKPQLMQVVPVEKEIQARQEALPYERVSEIIEAGKSFQVNECICKKEQGLLEHPCSKPLEVCLAIAPIEGIFKDSSVGRVIDKEEAYDVIRKSEASGLVHLTWNVESGHYFICNCCGCCCNVLRSISELGISDAVNSYYYARIDPDKCQNCGVCKNERCQVNAIEERQDIYEIIKERCIGCGLCISTCPAEAIQLVRKGPSQITPPPKDEMEWYQARGRLRGVDFSIYK